MYCCSSLVCIVIILCVFVIQYVYCCIYFNAGQLARSQYSECPATGHLDTEFSCFPCVYKQVLRWFPRLQVATTCFSCSPPDLNLLVANVIFCIQVKNHCRRVTTQLQLIIVIISFVQDIYTYIPETNYVPREYFVAAILLLLCIVLMSLVSVFNLL